MIELLLYLINYLLVGKYSNFLKDKLAVVQDFIKKDLVGGLRGLVNGVQGLVPIQKAVEVIPGLPIADYYQSIFDNTFDSVDGLTEVVEVTS